MKHFYLLFTALLLLSTNLSAQQITLFEQYNGRYDFTAFGNTLNYQENGGGSSCDIQSESSAELILGSTQTLVSAHLYWAGSGPGDLEVSLNGNLITAERVFALNFNTLDYFAAYVDVTEIVNTDGNGIYTLSELDLIDILPNYCNGGTNFGGWAIYIIYEDLTLTHNQINLYDGLEFVSASNPSLDIVLTNIEVSTQEFAKVGFLAWEGDQSISVTEALLVNGTLIDKPPLNPGDNAFNGTNSYTGSTNLYNMDLDYYDLDNIILPGNTSIDINLTSGQDFVMVNNIITKIKSQDVLLIDNPWYLENVIVNGDYYLPPSNNEVSDIIVDFTETNGFETKVCDLLGGTVLLGNMQFKFEDSVMTLGGCTEQENTDFQLIYLDSFFVNTIDDVFMYSITTENNGSLSLIITNSNGDQASFQNQILAINDEKLHDVRLYPNPVTNVLNLSLPQGQILEVYLYEVAGKEIFKQTGNTQQLNLESIEKGIYFLKVVTDNGFVTKKIIKQ